MTFFALKEQMQMPASAAPAAAPTVLDDFPPDARPIGPVATSPQPTVLDDFPADAVPVGPVATDAPQGPREVGFGEAAGRSAISSLASVPEYLNRGIAAALGLFDDEAAAAFSGRMVAPLANVRAGQEIDPATEQLTTLGKLGHATGALARDLPLAIATGGAMPAAAAGVRAAETAGTIASAFRSLAPGMARGAAAMTPSAMIESSDTYRRLVAQGVDPVTAAQQSALAALSYQLFGALPLAAPGKVLQRVGTGAALAAPQVELERRASNAIFGDQYPELQREFSIEDTIINAIPAAIMAGVLGPRARPGVRVRTEPGAAEPAGADPFSIAQSDPTLRAWLEANNITGAEDPRFAALQDRLAARQAADAERSGRPRQEPMLTADRQAIDDGMMDAAAEGAAGFQATPRPDVIPVDTQGRADVGDAGVRAGVELRGRFNAPAVVERPATDPEPRRMTADEITRARAAMEGGQSSNVESPPRMVAPEGRSPQTLDQVAEQRRAGEAFRLAETQRGRAGPDIADTQPAARPQGRDTQAVMLDEGFPVEILERRMVPDAKGRMVEVAKVRRYDPRTGQPEADAVEYEVEVRRLKRGNYSIDPRQSQDFVERARSPAPREMGFPEQTYRTTPPDPNERFPGAGDGRTPFPEQPDGPGPWPDYSSAEAEFVAREQARRTREQARDQYRDEGQEARARAEEAYRGAKFSNEASGKDRDGRWTVDDFGFVKSTKGGPMRFADQRQAARWILSRGQKESPDQLFEIENHPSGSGFAVRERGRNAGPKEPPPGGPEAPRGSSSNRKPEGAADAAPPRGIRGPEAPEPRVVRDEAPPRSQAARPEPEPFGLTPDEPAPARAREASSPYAKVPRRPRSLWQFVRDSGGLRDDTFARHLNTERGRANARRSQSELRQMIDGDKRFAGVIKAQTGLHVDDMALRAWEAGYFHDFVDRPSVADFWAALDDDMSGAAPRHTLDDQGAPRAYNEAIGANREIDRLADELGIDGHRDMTPEQFADAVAERLSVEEMARQINEIDIDIADQVARAERTAQEWLVKRGEAWGPEAVYRDDGALTQDEFERYHEQGSPADAESAQARGDQPETATRGAGDVSEGGRADGEEGGARARAGAEARPEPITETVDTVDGPREQYVAPGTERAGADELAARQRKADKEFAEQAMRGKKRATKPQEFANEGLFDDGRGPPDGGLFGDNGKKLYSGGVFDPDVWAAMAKAVPMSRKSMEAWARSARDFADDIKAAKNASSPGRWLKNLALGIFYHADGEMRTIADRYDSPTLKSIPDMMFAKAGRDTGQAITYDEAVYTTINRRLNDLHRILAPLEQDKAKLDQVATLVQNPGAITTGTPVHDAAAALTKFLRDQLAYLKEAGIEIGEVKHGYFPRVIDEAAVRANPDAFKAAAARALRTKGGVSVKDAAAQAEVWLSHIVMGQHQGLATPLARVGGDVEANFLKGRQLGKQADEILKAFYVRDPRQALTRYITQGVRRAEIARRFGDAWEKWSEIETRITKEDPRAAEALESLRNYIRTVTGINPPGMTSTALSALAWARTWSTIGLLEKATLSSLGEIVLPAARTGNILDAFRAIKNAGEAVARTKGAKQRRAFAEDLGVITSSYLDATISASRWSNDPGAKLQTKVQQKFFTRTGLEQWTAGTRAWSTDVARVFVRRLAKEVTEGGATERSSAFYLRELGVPKGQERAFARWLLSKKDGRPDVSDLDGEFGQAYRTAMIRFADQTIMRPSASTRPRWAAHPLMGLPFAIQSYNFAFQENVLNRMARLARNAGSLSNQFTALDRARVFLGPLAGMAALVAVQALMSEARDAVLGDPVRNKEQSTTDRMLKIASRAGLFGALDPIVQAASGARYNRDIATSLAGPVIGRMLGVGFDTALKAIHSNANTNTAERKVAQAVYDLILEPTVNLALTALPAASLVAAGVTQGVGAGATREAFTSAVAGPKQVKGANARPERPGRESRKSTR